MWPGHFGHRDGLDRRGKDAGIDAEDTITLGVQWENMKAGSLASAFYTASWIAPKSDVHSQQRFYYLGQKGEVQIDQAHRGYSLATDAGGFSSPNPLFMKYTPDAQGYFSGQSGYGYRSIEAFVDAVQRMHNGDSGSSRLSRGLGDRRRYRARDRDTRSGPPQPRFRRRAAPDRICTKWHRDWARATIDFLADSTRSFLLLTGRTNCLRREAFGDISRIAPSTVSRHLDSHRQRCVVRSGSAERSNSAIACGGSPVRNAGKIRRLILLVGSQQCHAVGGTRIDPLGISAARSETLDHWPAITCNFQRASRTVASRGP